MPKYNQQPPARRPAPRYVVYGILALVVIGVTWRLAERPHEIPCDASKSTTVFAHDGDTPQALVTDAVTQMGFSPEKVQNVPDAANQAELGIITPGTPLSLCLNGAADEVAVVDGTQIMRDSLI